MFDTVSGLRSRKEASLRMLSILQLDEYERGLRGCEHAWAKYN
jgi:hypothetical protein